MDIKLAIVGSRTFNDYATFNYVVNKICKENGYNIVEIISGGAKGADSFAEQYADMHKISKIVFRADWKKFGKRAGFIRNVDIIKECTHCIAFWDGDSHGTKHDIELCIEQKKDIYVYNFVTNKEFFRAGTEKGNSILEDAKA